jgi:hypothetical protein
LVIKKAVSTCWDGFLCFGETPQYKRPFSLKIE